jgi:hypothetical protein
MTDDVAQRLLTGSWGARREGDGDGLWKRGRGLRGLPRNKRVASLTPRMRQETWYADPPKVTLQKGSQGPTSVTQGKSRIK